MGDTTAHSGILALTKSTLSPQNKYDHKRRQKTFDDSLSTVHTCSGDICGSLQLKQQRFQRRQDLQHQHPSPCSSSDRERLRKVERRMVRWSSLILDDLIALSSTLVHILWMMLRHQARYPFQRHGPSSIHKGMVSTRLIETILSLKSKTDYIPCSKSKSRWPYLPIVMPCPCFACYINTNSPPF